MKTSRVLGAAAAFAAIVGGCTCGPPDDPTEIELGDTAVVVVVNPEINDRNEAAVPGPGASQAGVQVELQDRLSTTSTGGIAVLTGLDAGTGPLTVAGSPLQLTITAGELRELAVAQDGGAAGVMADVVYSFAGAQIVELDAGNSVADVNAALNASDRIVVIRGGTYTGDIIFNGSNVTLFGEGASGGRVTIDGNVEVNGSQNRIRGTRITGDLLVVGSSFALTFSTVGGNLTTDGSDTILLKNTVCGTASVTGGNITALGNEGLTPVPLPPDAGC